RTERQREASRRNGARSRGPVTAAGKCRSSANRRRHGLYSKTAGLDPNPTNSEHLAELRAELEAEFGSHRPAQPLIETAARALLGMRHVLALETSILNEEVAHQRIL